MGVPRVVVPVSAGAQRERFASVYSMLEKAVGRRAFPGAAFGVFAGNAVVALDGVGFFTYEGEVAVTASTVYDLASLTKVIAATSMAMLLHQRGQLELDWPLVRILPAFTQSEGVTLRLLLAHASGLPGYARLFAESGSRQELIDACLRLPLTAAPGTRAEYSDPGFILLGLALEKIAGESIESFCSREVSAPLCMTSTCFRPSEDWRLSIPPTEVDSSFRFRRIQGEVQDENCFALGGAGGHAGLFSNALDPLLYAQCVLQGGIFSAATVERFTTRVDLPAGSSRALGWDTPSSPSSSGRFFSARSAGHLGFSGTSLWIDLERKIAVVLLTNRTWPRRESQAIREIRPAFHDAVIESLRQDGLGLP